MANEAQGPSSAGGGRFATTHWSLVLAAAGTEDTRGQEALARLCQVYWYPLYAFVRRQGHSPHDAQDLTQEFFTRLLEKDYLETWTARRASSARFFLVALKHFLSKEWARAKTLKRGGGHTFVPLDALSAEDSLPPGTGRQCYSRKTLRATLGLDPAGSGVDAVGRGV